MSNTAIIIILVIVIIAALLFIISSVYDKKYQEKLTEYIASRGYTYYKADTIKIRDELQNTLFYNAARQPIPYSIIDTGSGKLVKIHIKGHRTSFTYTIFIDRVACPDIMFTPRTFSSAFMYNLGGFHEVFIEGISASYRVFCRDTEAAQAYLKDIAIPLSQTLGSFSVEVTNQVFICYDHQNRPRLKHYDYYIAKCREIRNILQKKDQTFIV